MAAVREPDTLFAVGNKAYELFEKNPNDIRIIEPMQNGRIQDVVMMEALLHTLLKKCGSYVGIMPVMYFSVPLDMTGLERRAYSTIAQKGRFRNSTVYFVEKPIADALAIGIPVQRAQGVMVVNIGEQGTEISVLSRGSIILSRLIGIGGQDFNSSIISEVRKKNNLTISRRTAQRLKFTLPDLQDEKWEGCRVVGIDTNTGLPRDGIVSSRTVTASVENVLKQIGGEISHVLERIPTQTQAAIRDEGIFLSGGSTRIPGANSFLKAHLDYPVATSRYYEYGTVTGLKRIIDHPELRRFAMLSTKRKPIR